MTLPAWLQDEHDDEAAELAELTGRLDAPLSDEMLDALAAKLLRRLSYAEDKVAKLAKRKQREHELVDEAYAPQEKRAESYVEHLRSTLETIAARMGFGPKKNKSRRLAFGTLGRRDESAKFVVEDKTACAKYLAERDPRYVRATVSMSLARLRQINDVLNRVAAVTDVPHANPIDETDAKLDVLVADVRRWHETEGQGELPAGCDLKPAATEYYADAVPAASLRATED